MRVIRGIKVGDLVEVTAHHSYTSDRGVGVVVNVINEKFKPLMLEVCFPSTKKLNRKKIIKLRASQVRVVSESR